MCHLVKRVTGCVVLLPMLAACHTWEIETLRPGQAATWDQPVRVVLVTGEEREFASARVSRDTLFGTPTHGAADSTAAIPIRRVQRVQRREFSEGRTFGVAVSVVLGSALVLVGAVLLALSSWGT